MCSLQQTEETSILVEGEIYWVGTKSDKAPETYFGDIEDHGVQPTDPQALMYEKIIKVVLIPAVTLELWETSMVSNDNDNGGCWPKQLLFCFQLLTSLPVLKLSLNVMTAKFYKVFQTLGWMGINVDKWKKYVFGLWNYMGVVSRFPSASPGHRELEPHHVH